MSRIGGRPLQGPARAHSPRWRQRGRAWKRAEAEGRVQTKGGDRKSNGKNSHLIARPREHFAALFHANEKYAQQAYALVTRDPVAAETVARGEHVKAAYEAPIARADLARPAVLRLGLHGRS